MRRWLYLLRHAKSRWDAPAPSDHDRPLAPRGERAAKAMAAVIAALAPAPDLVLCSTAARARQTLARAVPASPGWPVRLERAVYTFEAGDLLAVLRTLDDAAGAVLLIGHNPALEELTHRLMRPDDSDPDALARLRTKYPTAALATLRLAPGLGWADLRPDSAALTAFIRPRDLA